MKVIFAALVLLLAIGVSRPAYDRTTRLLLGAVVVGMVLLITLHPSLV